MPFHRGCYLKHPNTGVAGIWLELSVDPPGTLTGAAQSAWPAIVTSGGSKDTLATYAAKVNTALGTLCKKTVGGQANVQVVNVTVTFSSLSPLTIADVVISEGDCKTVTVTR